MIALAALAAAAAALHVSAPRETAARSMLAEAPGHAGAYALSRGAAGRADDDAVRFEMPPAVVEPARLRERAPRVFSRVGARDAATPCTGSESVCVVVDGNKDAGWNYTATNQKDHAKIFHFEFTTDPLVGNLRVDSGLLQVDAQSGLEYYTARLEPHETICLALLVKNTAEEETTLPGALWLYRTADNTYCNPEPTEFYGAICLDRVGAADATDFSVTNDYEFSVVYNVDCTPLLNAVATDQDSAELEGSLVFSGEAAPRPGDIGTTRETEIGTIAQNTTGSWWNFGSSGPPCGWSYYVDFCAPNACLQTDLPPVSFSGSATDVAQTFDTLTFTWDFSDGSDLVHTSAATHFFADDGNYTVTLTINDEDGGTASTTPTLTVNDRTTVCTAFSYFVTCTYQACGGGGSGAALDETCAEAANAGGDQCYGSIVADFETDASGLALPAREVIADQYSRLGMSVSSPTAGISPILYDSVTGSDGIVTPAGRDTGNHVSEYLVLVPSADGNETATDGATLRFEFVEDVTMAAVTLINAVDTTTVELYDSGDSLLQSVAAGGAPASGKTVVDVSQAGVARVDVVGDGAFAVATIEFSRACSV